MAALKHKENGDCIYLGDEGCSIWNNAPAVCKAFDCRELFKATTPKQRKRFVSEGLFSKEVMEAGKRLCINQNPGRGHNAPLRKPDS